MNIPRAAAARSEDVGEPQAEPPDVHPLPDDVPEEGLDLAAFYEEKRSYLWGLYAVYIGAAIALRVATLASAPGVETRLWLVSVVPNLVVMASFVALAFTGRRWLHTAVILLWLVVFNVSW